MMALVNKWKLERYQTIAKMVVISCTKEDCNWKTTDRDASLATVLAAELQNHTAVSHPAPAPATGPNDNTGRKAPPIELWLMFVKKWDMFKAGSKIPPAKLTNQLFQCCVDSLGDDILRGLDDVATVSETDLLAAIKKLSVQPVAIGEVHWATKYEPGQGGTNQNLPGEGERS